MALWPFIHQMNPDAGTQALASTEVDLAPVKEGQAITVLWRGKPVFIRNRTPEEIKMAADVASEICRSPARATTICRRRRPPTDPNRTKKGHENWIVLVGICTHLGCIPKGQALGDKQGRLRRLALPLPRLALRHGGTHPQRPGAAQSRGSALRLHLRHQDQDRLRSTAPMATHEFDLRADVEHSRKWMDVRLPIGRLMHAQFVDFPTPRNLNYLWTFGGILTFFLVAQIVTGIVLAMHYQPSAADAFNRSRHIRRDVNFGWLIRNLHAVGASMFFLAVYIHIFRGLYYGSYKAPREVLWILGVFIFLAHDGDGLHGLLAALGADELLGASPSSPTCSPRSTASFRASAPASSHGCGAATRCRAHAQPLLQPALPAAVRDRRPRRPAHLGAACRRPEQPHRARHQDAVGLPCRCTRMPSSRTRSRISPS